MKNDRFSRLTLDSLGLSNVSDIFPNLKDFKSHLFSNQSSSAKVSAFVALTFALLLWAFPPVLIKVIEEEISPTALAFHRLWIASLLLGIGQSTRFMYSQLSSLEERVKKGILLPSSHNYSPKTIAILVVAAVFFALTNIAWMVSLSRTTVANASLLHNFMPVFVALIGFFILDQRFDNRFIIGIVIATVGSVILGWDDFSYRAEQLQGDGIALLSALCWAIHLILIKQVRALSAVTITFYCCLISSLVSGLTLLIMPQYEIYPASYWGWLIVLGLSCTTALGNALIAYATKALSPEFVSLALLIDPIFCSLVAWSVLSESIDSYVFVAFFLILLGVYLATQSTSDLFEEQC